MSRTVLGAALALACALGCTRAPSRPPGVPESAVLVPGVGEASLEPRWISCGPDARCAGSYRCSLFSSQSGALVRQGCFMLSSGAAPGAPVSPTPSVIHIRGYQGPFLLVQPPWRLIPAPQLPIIGDPPAPSSQSPRPNAV